MSSFFARYNQLLKTRPLTTNMLTTGALFGTGDCLAQILFPEEGSKYDYPRTLRAVVYGTAVFAPIGDKWYKTLARLKLPSQVGLQGRLRAVGDTVLRVGADQLWFAPIVGIPLYYSVMTVFEQQKPLGETIVSKLERNWWPTLRSNWAVWPAFQMVNFYLVPVLYRLLAVNVFSIGWNCYLSWLHHRKDDAVSHIV